MQPPVVVNVFCGCGHPITLPPTNLSLVLVKEANMATATATWTPSVSPGVTSQTLTWTINGTPATPIVFNDNTTATATTTVNPGDKVDVAVFCTSPAGNSAVASASGTVPPGPPAPPTNVTLTFGP